jgi:hypothetical protein
MSACFPNAMNVAVESAQQKAQALQSVDFLLTGQMLDDNLAGLITKS